MIVDYNYKKNKVITVHVYIQKQCNMVVHLQLIKVMIGHNIYLYGKKNIYI